MEHGSSRRVGALAVVALLALSLGCYLAGTRSSAPAAVGTASAASTRKAHAAIANGQLLFVGASYTVGLGATRSSAGYATVVAHHLDRRFAVAAVSGTGFVCPGPRRQGTFAQRIDRLPPGLDPSIVLIQGGRNDAAYPTATVQAAARTTVTLARHRFAHAQVVVMGPIPASVPVGARLLQVRAAVRQAAREAGAGFIDPIAENWINGTNEHRFAGHVPFHPNDAGYAYIAARLAADLPAALDRAQPPRATQEGGHGTVPATPLLPVGTDLPEVAEPTSLPVTVVATGAA